MILIGEWQLLKWLASHEHVPVELLPRRKGSREKRFHFKSSGFQRAS